MELGSILEYSAIILALLYVFLAAKESILCWYPAFLSSGIYVYLTYTADLIGESMISLFYVAMAIYGWWQWKFGSKEQTEIQINEWPALTHALLIAGSTLASMVLGKILQISAHSELPYLDATSTVFALVATYMVTRKVLSNWIYWIFIDALNIYLYWNRGLEPTSGLYALYTILALVGYISWRRQWKRTLSSSQS